MGKKQKNNTAAPAAPAARSKLDQLRHYARQGALMIVGAFAIIGFMSTFGIGADNTVVDASQVVKKSLTAPLSGSETVGATLPGELASEGVCRAFEGPSETVFACVPLRSPEGGEVERIYEDSSARYSDGYVIDAETNVFRR